VGGKERRGGKKLNFLGFFPLGLVGGQPNAAPALPRPQTGKMPEPEIRPVSADGKMAYPAGGHGKATDSPATNGAKPQGGGQKSAGARRSRRGLRNLFFSGPGAHRPDHRRKFDCRAGGNYRYPLPREGSESPRFAVRCARRGTLVSPDAKRLDLQGRWTTRQPWFLQPCARDRDGTVKASRARGKRRPRTPIPLKGPAAAHARHRQNACGPRPRGNQTVPSGALFPGKPWQRVILLRVMPASSRKLLCNGRTDRVKHAVLGDAVPNSAKMPPFRCTPIRPPWRLFQPHRPVQPNTASTALVKYWR